MTEILLVSEARAVGGAEIYLERLASSFGAARATVAIPSRRALEGWRERLARSGVSVLTYPPGAAGWLPLAAAVRRGPWRVVHVNLPSTYDGGAGLLPWLLAVWGGRPVVVTEHLTRIPRSRRRRAMKLLTAGAVRRVITVSEASRRTLVAEGISAERIRVIPNGVAGPAAMPPMPPMTGSLRVAVLASLEPRKQIGLLVEAAGISSGNWTIDVAGEGPLRQELEARAAALRLREGRIRFVGAVRDPFAFLAEHHLLALPSRLEAMPLAVLEAYSAGRGALLSALPGMSEILADGRVGRLLPPDDPTAWAHALDDLDAHREILMRWGEEARRSYEERFTLARCAAETEAVYAAATVDR